MPSVALPRSFDIAAVTAVATELSHALALGELTIDAAAVVKIDAAALQLLCATALAARASGVRLAWSPLPAVLEDGARVLALSETLGWSRAPAQENR